MLLLFLPLASEREQCDLGRFMSWPLICQVHYNATQSHTEGSQGVTSAAAIAVQPDFSKGAMNPLPKLFRTPSHPMGTSHEPDYLIYDGHFRRTIHHPHGWSEFADYVMQDDGKLYRTDHHPDGPGQAADYEFRGDRKVYRAAGHPKGTSDLALYELRD